MTYVGIDIGKLGGIAAISENKIELHATPRVGKEIDQKTFADILFGINVRAQGKVIIVIEDVSSIYDSSAGGNFEFGRSLGIVEGLVAALQLPFYKVHAKTWQKVCFEGIPLMKLPGIPKKGRGVYDTKAMALLAAQRLYPKLDLRESERCRVPHKGIVDALLMAHYCKLKY